MLMIEVGQKMILSYGLTKPPIRTTVRRVTPTGKFRVECDPEPLFGDCGRGIGKAVHIRCFNDEEDTWASLCHEHERFRKHEELRKERQKREVQERKERAADRLRKTKEAVKHLKFSTRGQLPDNSRYYVLEVATRQAGHAVVMIRCEDGKYYFDKDNAPSTQFYASWTTTQGSSNSSLSPFWVEKKGRDTWKTDEEGIWSVVDNVYWGW